ncbi:MAG: VOC family protein [Candidatus Thiodiazotropha sp. (ex Dulcina madagascariensis)]|nr:VOC family protein [Candidatus Thiodiazotropha sp. (ex Dulcina madagascariensis)]
MINNPVGWFEIYVQDILRAKAFYENVFSIKLDELKMPDLEMWTFPMNEEGTGASGAIVQMEGCPSGGNSTMVYFSCEDCATEENKASVHGGKIFKAKFSIGEHGFISLVTDTEGNMIGLHSMK